MRAMWHDTILAESDDTLEVEGNHYFPQNSLRYQYFFPSTYQTTCPWKGKANYMHIKVDGDVNSDAAWYYPTPLPDATHITDRVAFWRGVVVSE